MFMTPQEVADLTGYQKPGKQIAWLTAELFGTPVQIPNENSNTGI